MHSTIDSQGFREGELEIEDVSDECSMKGSLRLLFVRSLRRGCATSEDMLWKLDALQCFIRDLHWVSVG